MAPSRTTTVKSKHASKHASNKSGLRSKSSTKPTNDGVVKMRKPKGKGLPSKPQGNATTMSKLRKKRRVYTEKELDIPSLNMITPVGVEKPKGKKKGKVFVDDVESMRTILAIVNAEKDGQIESKMMKARQMEEIREARKAEQEKRMEMKRAKFEEAKDTIRKKRKRPEDKDGGASSSASKKEAAIGTKPLKLKRKTVAFA